MIDLKPDQRRLLAENARLLAADPDADVIPAVRLFHPLTGWSWILVAMEENEPSRALGFIDMNEGSVDFGLVDLARLPGSPSLGLGVEVDQFWIGCAPSSAYSNEAISTGKLNGRPRVISII